DVAAAVRISRNNATVGQLRYYRFVGVQIFRERDRVRRIQANNAKLQRLLADGGRDESHEQCEEAEVNCAFHNVSNIPIAGTKLGHGVVVGSAHHGKANTAKHYGASSLSSEIANSAIFSPPPEATRLLTISYDPSANAFFVGTYAGQSF